MYFPEIKQKAIQLRKEGYSHNYILKHVSVAKSTLSDWLHDIPFTPNQYTLDTIGKAHIASGVYKHQIKVKSLEKAELQARKDILNLSDRDIMMLGLGLYIGEGGKTENIKVRLFLYPDNIEKDCIEYWSKQIGVPDSQFFKPTIDIRTNKKMSNKRKLPFGTAHMSINGSGVYLHRLIMAWINRVL